MKHLSVGGSAPNGGQASGILCSCAERMGRWQSHSGVQGWWAQLFKEPATSGIFMLPPNAVSDPQWLGACNSRELLVLPSLQSGSPDQGLGAPRPSRADPWLCLSCCILEKQKKTRKIWDHSETSSIQVSRLPASRPPVFSLCCAHPVQQPCPSWALPGLLDYSFPPRAPLFFGPSMPCKHSHLGRQLGSSCLPLEVNLAWLMREGGGRGMGS